MTQNRTEGALETDSFSSRPYFKLVYSPAMQTKANTTFQTFAPPFSPLGMPAAAQSKFVQTLTQNCFLTFQKVPSTVGAEKFRPY